MFSLEDRAHAASDGISRREWLRVGGLGALGLSLPTLLQAGQTPRPAARRQAPINLRGATFGRAKNVIFLWLQGGPPQHETFDPKPDAPSGIRGPFRPIATNVPGIRFCELLPRTAGHADKLAVMRSLHTNDDNHDVSGYWILTGYPYGPGSARQIKPNDWPYFGSIVKMLKPSERMPALSSVWIPDLMRLNDNVTPAGQTAGFLGRVWETVRFVGDPASPAYRIEGLDPTGDLTPARMNRRRDLLAQVDTHLRNVERGGAIDSWSRLSQQAFDLITSGNARRAFDLTREPERVRDRYGRYSWGQSVLLGRRLIEAGVRLVHVNWVREPGDSAVDNPMWDTHAQNADRLQDCLCPQFDVTFTALLDDLDQRGLLDETLVVAIGEFGRTPRINNQGGRDHWGRVFSCALAGAGIAGGQVYGASDRLGSDPALDPTRPHDLVATIFYLLGIDPNGVFYDKNNRPHLITRGEPLHRLLGMGPATLERCEPEGDVAFVPPYDTSLLLDTDFRSGRPLVPTTPPSRERGWRATPIGSAFGVQVTPGAALLGWAGAGLGGTVSQGARLMLAQEIRNARGGQYTFTVQASGGGAARDSFDRLFNHLSCRLVLFRFANPNKDPAQASILASTSFRPVFGESPATYEVGRFLGSTVPGANFSIGNGLGIGIIVEKTSPGAVTLERDAFLRIHGVTLTFSARPRDESVTE
ncbi:MAG: DUF1501 domain-containing protein [Planctomycetes bacterium]|nr:DUF1501 domain-containing protein [Planctomycetota bacterium]